MAAKVTSVLAKMFDFIYILLKKIDMILLFISHHADIKVYATTSSIKPRKKQIYKASRFLKLFNIIYLNPFSCHEL